MIESLPAPKMVEMSIRGNLKALSKDFDEIEVLLNQEVPAIAEMEADLPVRYQRLMVVVKRIGEIVAPVVPCKSGCNHCCKMAVTISSYEAELIGQAIGIKPRKHVRIIVDKEELISEYMNVPCPFLKNHKCAIYENRPLPCRTHYNISSYPVLCDTVNHG